MKIECREYALHSEFLPLVHISEHLWRIDSKRIIAWLDNFFEYEFVMHGHVKYIKITRQLMDYVDLPRKGKEQEVLDTIIEEDVGERLLIEAFKEVLKGYNKEEISYKLRTALMKAKQEMIKERWQ